MLNPVFPVKFKKADCSDRVSKSRIKENPIARVKNGTIIPLRKNILSGRHFGSARMKAAKAKWAGIRRESIPKECAKNLPAADGKSPIPKRALNSENPRKILQSPKITAITTVIVRCLKGKSDVNLCLKSAKNDKLTFLRFIIG